MQTPSYVLEVSCERKGVAGILLMQQAFCWGGLLVFWAKYAVKFPTQGLCSCGHTQVILNNQILCLEDFPLDH